MQEFIIRSLLGGVIIGAASGPLGSLILWRRMAFFGDAIAHATILGVAIGVVLNIGNFFSVLFAALVFTLLINLLKKNKFYSSDTILSMVTSASMALGVIIIAMNNNAKINIMSLLFGDILTISYSDIAVICVVFAAITFGIMYIWEDLLLTTIDADLAKVEGVDIDKVNFIFTLLLAIGIAISIKIVGALLVSSILLIPPMIARAYSKTPISMGIIASFIAIIAVVLGFAISLNFDTPTGPTITVVLALILFVSNGLVSVVR